MGKPITHHMFIKYLLDAIFLPKQVAVCKCDAHTNSFDPVYLGNARAVSAAKLAASKDPFYAYVTINQSLS